MTEMPGVAIRRLTAESAFDAVPQLSALLIDAVDSGASVGFMSPLTTERASKFWETVAQGIGRNERAVLVAEDAQGIAGTVQLLLALPENQPHRADLVKMLVHTRARRMGIARRLMREVEKVAQQEAKSVVVLDTVTNSAAAQLYMQEGWQRVGDIPNYALMPDGSFCSTTYFYKRLNAVEQGAERYAID